MNKEYTWEDLNFKQGFAAGIKTGELDLSNGIYIYITEQHKMFQAKVLMLDKELKQYVGFSKEELLKKINELARMGKGK